MKRIFTFAIALMSMFGALQLASAANVVFTVTVPTPTYECWIVGSFNSWNNNDKKMTMVDATHYTITMDDATWAAGVTTANVQYKYCSGGNDWAYVEKHANGDEIRANRVYTGTNVYIDPLGVNPTETATGTNGVDVVAKWATVYNPTIPALPLNVTVQVLTPVGTIQCYIVGTFNNWAGPTAPVDSCKMTKLSTNPDGTIIFEKTIFTADANKLAYHFCSGPDWTFEQKTPTGDYKYPEVNPVVTEWKKIFDPTKVGNFVVTITVPAGTLAVWSVGSFQGWSMDNAVACTKNLDGTFSFSVSNSPGFEYKLYNKKDNSWGFNAVDALGADIPNTAVSFPADVNTNVTVVAWKQSVNGISQVRAAANVIYTNNSSIVVEGVTSNIALFDITGRRIQSEKMVGTFTSISLNTGLYIVQVDGATRKVAVK